MSNFLRENPSKSMTRTMLIAGLVVFISVYTYILGLFGKMGIATDEFNQVWLSFDVPTFEAFFQKVLDAGDLQTFVWSFSLNVISMIGFLFTFFALSLMLARKLPETSKLSKISYAFPVISILISVLDIIPSLVFTMAASKLPGISTNVVNIISGGYVSRVVLLYALMLWMIVAGISLFIAKVKSARSAVG